MRLELYSFEQLKEIVLRSSVILGIPCTNEGAFEIAKRSRGTPRIANRLLKRVRDFAEVLGNGKVTEDIAVIALDRLEIDALGLDTIDKRVLEMIIKGYGGGPVGLDTLAAAIGEEAITLEDVCEPYLMQLGFLSRTPRGRCATALAYKHLKMPLPPTAQAAQMIIDVNIDVRD
jgi:Holliday junction DNA helicase RuvB